jgi:hypothetical protein
VHGKPRRGQRHARGHLLSGNASCGSGGGYWATGYYQNYAEDMGLHQWTGPLPGLTPLPIFDGFINWWNGGISLLTGVQNPQVGDYVCLNGITTGSGCSYVSATNVTVTYTGGTTLAGMVRMDGACTLPGDSGGPWTMAWVTKATMINSGGVLCNYAGHNAYATVVGTISSVLGVSVMIN